MAFACNWCSYAGAIWLEATAAISLQCKVIKVLFQEIDPHLSCGPL